MGINLQDWVGNTQVQTDDLTAGLLQRYEAVIGAKSVNGVAPQGLHWCLCLPSAPMGDLGQDGHPKTGGFLPPSALPRRMWASSKVEFTGDIKAGSRVERRSTIASVTEKTGRSGSLLFVNVEHVTLSDDVIAVKETQTIVYRDAPTQTQTLPEPINVDLAQWDVTEHLTPEPALLFRYSALTFNTHRIHYDYIYASRVEGYPALVVHGPLMASLLLRFANEQAAGQDIHTFEFRGLAPAFCNQDLFIVARKAEDGLDLAIIGPDGNKKMSAKARYKP